MKKLKHYFKVSFNSIMRNKEYAVICVLGTALTFIFITFLVHMSFAMNGDYPPSVHSERIITLNRFSDTKGNAVNGMSLTEQKLLLEQIKEYDGYEQYSLTNTQPLHTLVNESFALTFVTFGSAGFWDLYAFDFVAGRPFTENECNNRRKCAVITKNLSRSKFHTVNSIGRKIELQGDEFEIVGVVDDFSLFASPTESSEIWVPYVFNPADKTFTLRLLFSTAESMPRSKETVAKLVQHFFALRNITVPVSANTLLTEKESMYQKYGANGKPIALLILVFLLVPAVNIVSLNNANTRNRYEEIAIRRAFGAGRLSPFFLILFENLLLTLAGTFIGILLAKPVMLLIQFLLLGDLPMLRGAMLMPRADSFVILAVIVPLMVLFLFIFSGSSAYSITRRSIADILNGGAK